MPGNPRAITLEGLENVEKIEAVEGIDMIAPASRKAPG
jgi:2-keto-3-deoxy-L-rhamnonate aldolase RhmA